MVLQNGNELVRGMTFLTFKSVAEFLGLKDTNHCNLIKLYMKRYCVWHKDNGIIYIDDVFDEEKISKKGNWKGYIYEIGQIIESKTGKFIIKDQYRKKEKFGNRDVMINTYKCECLIHNDFQFELFQHRIKQGIGCPLCGHRKVIHGIASLYDEHKELLQYLVNPDDAKNITSMSSKKILCKCLFCGHEKMISVNNLVQHGFSCQFCSDHISYPNKFVRKFLDQLNIEYESEKIFQWSDKKVYDQYIPKLNMIIENHGIQHYEKTSFTDIEYQKSNDEYKMLLARQNGITNYIVIDCRISDMNYIKQSILNSELVTLLNFKKADVDWNTCDIFASTNSELIKVCEEYNKNNNITRVCEILHHSAETVRNYLLVGTKAGLCEYEKNNKEKNGFSLSYMMHSYPIYCITDDIYFATKRDCECYYKSNYISDFNGDSLYSYINKGKPYKNKYFKYISRIDFNNMKDESILNNSIIVYGNYYDARYLKNK